MPQFVARVKVLERHADGTARVFEKTLVVNDKVSVGELMNWRNKKVHDPLNGEFASTEVVLTPDDID